MSTASGQEAESASASRRSLHRGLSRRQWLTASFATLAVAALGNREMRAAETPALPSMTALLAEFLSWADRVGGEEAHADHPRGAQAEALKALGADAPALLKVAGNKEGHVLTVDEAKQSLVMKTVSPSNEDRGVTLSITVHRLDAGKGKWKLPPSAGGEIPPHPAAIIAVSTEDSEGDYEARSFQLYQYGRIGQRSIFSAAKVNREYIPEHPVAKLCLPAGTSVQRAAAQADASRKEMFPGLNLEWDADSTVKALRARLLHPDTGEPQWSAHPTEDGRGLLISPFWPNDSGSDIAAEWAAPAGTAEPDLHHAFMQLVRALRYEWDAAAGHFVLKGTAARPHDVEFLMMETGEAGVK